MTSTLTRKLNGLGAVLSSTRRCAKEYGTSPAPLAFRAGLLLWQEFSLAEILGIGLLDPKVPARSLRSYASKEMMWPILRDLNGMAEKRRVDDKLECQRICEAAGLPVPGLLGIYTPRPEAAETDANADLEARREWKDRLKRLPPSFVAKPTLSGYGKGVMIVDRVGEAFAVHGLGTFDDEGLLDAFDKAGQQTPTVNAHYSRSETRILLQETLVAHPDLAALSGTRAVQCLRICTLLDADDQPHIFFAFLKVLANRNVVDNYDHGRSGNLLAFLSRDTGRIDRVIGPERGRIAAKSYSKHPDTGAELIGFGIPCWQESCELARRAAERFRPLGAVGWDIAVTADGPVLIEGNLNWDPSSPFYIERGTVRRWAAARSGKATTDVASDRTGTLSTGATVAGEPIRKAAQRRLP